MVRKMYFYLKTYLKYIQQLLYRALSINTLGLGVFLLLGKRKRKGS